MLRWLGQALSRPPQQVRLMGSHRLTSLAGLLIIEIVALDLISKWVVFDLILNPPLRLPVTDFFNLVVVWNDGVSFGLLRHLPAPYDAWILGGMAAAVSLGLLVWLLRADHPRTAMALAMVIGGALGNLYDRLTYGAVRDFLDFHVAGWHWPAFNVADSAIVLGVGLLLWQTLTQPPKSS